METNRGEISKAGEGERLDERIRLELNRRRAMYDQLARSYPGLTGIPPQLLRDLRIYGGYQGIYYDKANTSTLVGGAGGVTVSILIPVAITRMTYRTPISSIIIQRLTVWT